MRRFAFASSNGYLIDRQLSRCEHFFIIEVGPDGWTPLGAREVPKTFPSATRQSRMDCIAQLLQDCEAVFVSRMIRNHLVQYRLKLIEAPLPVELVLRRLMLEKSGDDKPPALTGTSAR